MSYYKKMKQYLKDLSTKIRKIKDELKNYQRKNNGYGGKFYKELFKLKYEFRHQHIAYCLARGRKYENIEEPREGNGPNFDLIQEYVSAYEMPKNVRTCA